MCVSGPCEATERSSRQCGLAPHAPSAAPERSSCRTLGREGSESRHPRAWWWRGWIRIFILSCSYRNVFTTTIEFCPTSSPTKNRSLWLLQPDIATSYRVDPLDQY